MEHPGRWIQNLFAVALVGSKQEKGIRQSFFTTQFRFLVRVFVSQFPNHISQNFQAQKTENSSKTKLAPKREKTLAILLVPFLGW